MNERQLTAIQFLEEAFIPDMQRALDAGLRYYVFPLLCQAVEIMGALYDTYPFDEPNQTEARFTRALKTLFKDRRYANNQSLLYQGLRGSMIHQLRPGAQIGLASEQHDGVSRNFHMSHYCAGGRILVIEKFFEDFKAAFIKLQNSSKKPNSGIDKTKLSQTYFRHGPRDKDKSTIAPLQDPGIYSISNPSLSGR